ncbi:uncharacterized protein LOC122267185 isoform X2 [Penaeus japonicus]|uniref:uncharacterized protein LOC122267185 isoform X2 n=1 Tax=Penaeus japonicus TaxID=27405 RepID=UPI001C716292|nr:uncharacterized protein LOC122267185 isoform X2 [Penaeus japonicus]
MEFTLRTEEPSGVASTPTATTTAASLGAPLQHHRPQDLWAEGIPRLWHHQVWRDHDQHCGGPVLRQRPDLPRQALQPHLHRRRSQRVGGDIGLHRRGIRRPDPDRVPPGREPAAIARQAADPLRRTAHDHHRRGRPAHVPLESQRGFNLVSDIFATNVVAKDPYSGRTVNLIDSRGCPIDNYVFPSLGKARDGDGLEARFNAFKIPESNFLIFEATVRNCRGGCVPARCTLGNGREETESYGRRRRDAGDDPSALALTDGVEDEEDPDEEEQVHGIYEVYLSRDEIDDSVPLSLLDEVCLASSEYYSLVAGLIITITSLVASLLAIVYCVRKHRQLDSKNAAADAGNPYHNQPQQKSKFGFPGSHARTLTQPARQVYFPANEATATAPQGEDGAATSSRYPDPSEPIYTDPSLFERSRSLRSIALSEMPTRRRHADGEE